MHVVHRDQNAAKSWWSIGLDWAVFYVPANTV